MLGLIRIMGRMFKISISICLLLLSVLAGAPQAHAEKRAALVIGHSAYKFTQRLPNPANDALAVAATLKSIGFRDVEVAIDNTIEGLRNTIRKFGNKAATLDLALVYYAGHGMELGGANYLLPIDAKLKTDRDLDYEAITLDLILRAIEPAKRMRIVILDACRNNPFAAQMKISGTVQRSVTRGLVRVEPSGDTLVAYAAKAGTVAEDGDGKNSPYTSALLKHVGTPGLEISMLFRRVRDTVLAETNGRQEPFVYGSLRGEAIYLVPPETKSAANTAAARKQAPKTAAAKSTAAKSGSGELRFDEPVPTGAYPVRGQSLETLAMSVPLNSPIEGLDEELWKKPCASCHQWNRDRLCKQGSSYINAPSDVFRHPHPFGGAYKLALMRWAKAGCK